MDHSWCQASVLIHCSLASAAHPTNVTGCLTQSTDSRTFDRRPRSLTFTLAVLFPGTSLPVP